MAIQTIVPSTRIGENPTKTWTNKTTQIISIRSKIRGSISHATGGPGERVSGVEAQATHANGYSAPFVTAALPSPEGNGARFLGVSQGNSARSFFNPNGAFLLAGRHSECPAIRPPLRSA